MAKKIMRRLASTTFSCCGIFVRIGIAPSVRRHSRNWLALARYLHFFSCALRILVAASALVAQTARARRLRSWARASDMAHQKQRASKSGIRLMMANAQARETIVNIKHHQ